MPFLLVLLLNVTWSWPNSMSFGRNMRKNGRQWEKQARCCPTQMSEATQDVKDTMTDCTGQVLSAVEQLQKKAVEQIQKRRRAEDDHQVPSRLSWLSCAKPAWLLRLHARAGHACRRTKVHKDNSASCKSGWLYDSIL